MQPIADTSRFTLSRRLLLAGAGASAVLALPGCAAGLGGFGMIDAIRRLLFLSSERAFARLLAPGGFWENSLARLRLPDMLGTRGGIIETMLTSGVFRDQLERRLNDVAYEGARAAAPAVTDAVRTVGFGNAVAIVTGNPTAATSYLRDAMGGRLIDIMLPDVGNALRLANDPLIGQALSAVAGLDLGGLARNVANQADNAIWGEIGREEASIRANPRATGDPLLIGVFGPT